ncbi:cadherin-like beta sandwich domain-containing protein [Paenibacillus oenotherae]|uniref:Cadherin-like beta sandwich domain-containing protein n=1 Tax=Paenibacillus oenotherae TaxID=1435645 RepID=A0ABS7D7Q5_9BACL|nr:cadherin-like beta sandwich domain-containing protein [Paenibacillus oenotherae]MBW7475566.1 cadherin-like beta sandwich domain-containing protein [Paenibacillus oenotherae]
MKFLRSQHMLVAKVALAMILLFTVLTPLQAGAAPYLGIQGYSAGSFPTDMTVADFNGDGHMDVAVANTSSGDISVRLGIGDGTFSSQATYPSGNYTTSVTNGDFNGDGKIDLAAANQTTDTVSIFLGIGDGTFASALSIPTLVSPNYIAVADFNNDSKMDLAVSHRTIDQVSIMIGIGDGTFGAPVGLGVGDAPYKVVTGDFNGDGRMDVVVSNFGSDNVSVLLGDGLGALAVAVNYAVEEAPLKAAVGDVNGDGYLDLAVASSRNLQVGALSILTGKGDGTFNSAVHYGSGGNDTRSVVLADFTGDGELDAAMGNWATGTFSILAGDGNGGFATAVTYSAGGSVNDLVSSDFNGDGLLDFAFARQTHNDFGVRLAASNDASLQSLTLSGGATLSPSFSAGTFGYTSSVSYSVNSLSVTPVVVDATASVTVAVNGGTPEAVASGAASSALPLNVGVNTIDVAITAQDGTTIRTYTVDVTRQPNTDASLSGLGLSGGAVLSPSFSAGTLGYTSSVAYSQSDIRVTPVAHATASVTVAVNGGTPEAVASGAASSALPLNVGVNTIDVAVTAQDGTTIRTYTVDVTRQLNTDASLSGLSLSGGAVLSPSFSAGTLGYTSSVPYSVNSLSVTPIVADATAAVTVAVNGGTPEAVASGAASSALPLNVGVNKINVAVTAQDGTTIRTYTVDVTRQLNTDASLSGLSLSGGAVLSPSFSAGTLGYTSSVSHSVNSLSVTPIVADATATVTVAVNGGTPEAVASGAASSALPLNVGVNTIDVAVTAQDGTTIQTYTVDVTRSNYAGVTTPSSSINNLSGLSLQGGAELSPAFSPSTLAYASSVANNVDSVSVIATLADGKATVKVRGNNGTPVSIASGSVSAALPLKTGANVIDVIVTAEDGTSRSYTITLTRQVETEGSPQEAVCPFTDLEGHWAKVMICEAAELGIVEGVSVNLFAPDRTVTRTEFAVMMLRALEIPISEEPGTLPFSDKESIPEWALSAISTGVNKGMLDGYPDGTFRSQQTITRSEMAAMIAKVMKWKADSEQYSTYADGTSIPGWARSYVEAVHANGLLQGRGDNLFVPKGITTRAEAAVVMLRLWNTSN